MKLTKLIGTLAIGVGMMTSSAFATTITATFSTYGNLAAFAAGSGAHNVTAGQFDLATVNAGITCTAGYTCSGATLTGIDVTITGNVAATITLNNPNTFTAYVGALNLQGGTFSGGPTSGTSMNSAAVLQLTDPLTGLLINSLPTATVATDTRRRIACGTGTPTSGNFSNCLAVLPGSRTFNGTGTDTVSTGFIGGGVDFSAIGGDPIYDTYAGTGVVTFTLSLTAGTNVGTLNNGITVTNNSTSTVATTNALEVMYTYEYTETLIPSGVPEPGTMFLGGAALLVAGFLRKRTAR